MQEEEVWEPVLDIPDDEFWAVRLQNKRTCSPTCTSTAAAAGRPARSIRRQVVAAGPFLQPQPLTIGFARRFATYKRATLIFSDPDRLARILTDPERPVQLIFAGKAHPADDGGKRLHPGDFLAVARSALRGPHRLRRGLRHAPGLAPLRRRRRLAQQPARAARGERHLRHESGRQRRAEPLHPRRLVDRRLGTRTRSRVGHRARPNCWTRRATAADADAIYTALEQEVVPLFYQRDEANLPREWIRRSKEAIRTLAPALLFAADGHRVHQPALRARLRRRARAGSAQPVGRGGD